MRPNDWYCPDESCGFVLHGKPKKPRVTRCERCKRYVLVKGKMYKRTAKGWEVTK